jgi:hypothetical protein
VMLQQTLMQACSVNVQALEEKCRASLTSFANEGVKKDDDLGA